MGSGAGVLRQSMGRYDGRDRIVRLERPNLPYHHHIIVISVTRIPGFFPPVEQDEHDAIMFGTSLASSSSSSADDYDYQNELENRRWLNGGADERYRW